jgi:peptidoglycan/LPS O-acetylase OafA/YrhL
VTKQLHALTSIRFFAALWVVLFHARAFHPSLDNPIVNSGHTGVSLFFVLSGFILSYNYLGKPLDIRGFLWARFSRIYPVYLLGLAIAAPFYLRDVIHHLRPAGPVVAAPLLLQAWVPTWSLQWNGPGWSLSSEAFFYALFPLVGAWVYRFAQSRFSQAIALCLLLSSMTRLIAFATGLGAGLPPIPLLSLPEFLLGICIGSRSLAGDGRKLAIGSLTVIFGVLILIPYQTLQLILLTPMFAALIFGLSRTPWLSNRWLVNLGDASYSLYILHIPVLMWLQHLTKHSGFGGLPLVVTFCVLSIAASIVSYNFVELPARSYLLKYGRKIKMPAGASTELQPHRLTLP